MNAKMVRSSSRFLLLTLILLYPASAHADTYVVAQGDTLTKIAKQYNTTILDLMNNNQLSSDKLSIGQALQIDNAAVPTQTVAMVSTTDLPPASPEATQTTTESQPQSTPESKEAMVAADVLNVREQPSLDGAIIAKLPYGAKIVVVEKGEEWTKVIVDGKETYVASAYLTSPAPAQAAVLPTDVDEWTKQLYAVFEPLLNTPYRYGGSRTDGFDCSGFTAYVYQQFGISLPRTSEQQFSVGEEVALDQAMPGDLLFYDALKRGKVSHVAMYVGNGMIVHANGTSVRFEKEVNMHNLYPFYGVKRIVTHSNQHN